MYKDITIYGAVKSAGFVPEVGISNVGQWTVGHSQPNRAAAQHIADKAAEDLRDVALEYIQSTIKNLKWPKAKP